MFKSFDRIMMWICIGFVIAYDIGYNNGMMIQTIIAMFEG